MSSWSQQREKQLQKATYATYNLSVHTVYVSMDYKRQFGTVVLKL